MTDREILDNAFTKIVKNSGWLSPKLKELIMKSNPQNDPFYWIFNHDFAKAFWGEDECNYDYDESKMWEATYEYGSNGIRFKGKLWQYHLQQMVLEENPLKYLERLL